MGQNHPLPATFAHAPSVWTALSSCLISKLLFILLQDITPPFFFCTPFSYLSFASLHYPYRFALAFVPSYCNYVYISVPLYSHHELSEDRRPVLFLFASPAPVQCLEHSFHMIRICRSLQTFINTIERDRVQGNWPLPMDSIKWRVGGGVRNPFLLLNKEQSMNREDGTLSPLPAGSIQG